MENLETLDLSNLELLTSELQIWAYPEHPPPPELEPSHGELTNFRSEQPRIVDFRYEPTQNTPAPPPEMEPSHGLVI